MASPSLDRRLGLTGNKAYKAPCDVATTTNITLSGEQTIDGVVTSGSRVLVWNQTNAVDNGIWDSSTGSWSRAIDCNTNQDLAKGTQVYVSGGTAYAGNRFVFNSSNPIQPGTSSITITQSTDSSTLQARLADPTSASNGDNMVGHAYSVTPTEGSVAAALLQKVQVFNYLTNAQKAEARSGTVTLDMSSQIQTALNTGLEIDWGDNRFTYLCTGLTVPITVRAMYGSATIKCSANSTTMIQWPADTSRAHARWMGGGLKLDANGKTGCTGVKFGSTTNNPSAGAQEAILYVGLRDLLITGFDTNLDNRVSMEHSYDNVVLKSGIVGMKMYSDPVNGGCNSNTFRGLRLQGNSVGAIIKNNVAAYALAVHNNQFSGCIIQENTVCGLVFIGCTAQAIDNLHIEGNGAGAASITVDGYVIPKCDVHIDGSHVLISDTDSASSLASSFNLVNSSRLTTNGLTGYGSSSTDKISCDATSAVYEIGATAAIGIVNNLASYGQITTVSGLMATHGAPLCNVTRGINLYNSNPMYPDTSNVDGVATFVNAKTDFGLTPRVVYAASVGSTATNRLNMALMTCVASTWNFSSFLARPSADCTMTFRWSAGASVLTKVYSLTASSWHRVTFTSFGAATHSVFVYPADSVGATLDIQAVQCTSASLREVSNVYQSGSVNTATELYNRYTAAPTTGTWIVGDVVWQQTPAAGGTMGFVCTTAGTPGTWKTFGNITP